MFSSYSNMVFFVFSFSIVMFQFLLNHSFQTQYTFYFLSETDWQFYSCERLCVFINFAGVPAQISLSPVDCVSTAFAAIIVFRPTVSVPLLHMILAPAHSTHPDFRIIPLNLDFGALANIPYMSPHLHVT